MTKHKPGNFQCGVKYIRLLFLALAVGTQAQPASQISESESGSWQDRSVLQNISRDFGHIMTAPARTSTTECIVFSGIALLYDDVIAEFDQGVDTYYKKRGDKALGLPGRGLVGIGNAYDRIGHGSILLMLSGSALGAGLVFDDSNLLLTSRLLVESYFITGAITMAGKYISGRYRPYTGRESDEFQLFKFSKNHRFTSFPSGHTSSAFAMMTVLAKMYDHWYVQVPAYTFAAGVALQRVESRDHWITDTLVGAALGYWIGSSLVGRYKVKSGTTVLEPFAAKGKIGLALHF